MIYTLRDLFRDHFPSYARVHRLPGRAHRAAWSIRHCRSAELGGHVQRCACGAVERVWYNSCRHRLCAQCAGLARERWLAAERARLLATGHHHVVFTLPHDLNALWQYNREGLTNLLFTSAAATLKELLADPRYLGAEGGLLLGLHTWNRSLGLHPHIHALVTDGGFRDGQWRTPRRSHFLPARVVMALFRGKFLAALRTALASGALKLPPEVTPAHLASLCNRLGRAKWHVYLAQRYAHGEGVATYLARYLRGGPLKNGQLRPTPDGRLRLQPRRDDTSAERPTPLTLSPAALLTRYLAHVPIPGQHLVRHYGLYAPSRGDAREAARAVLPSVPGARPTASAPPAVGWAAFLERFAQPVAAVRCRDCQGPIVAVARLPRAPPF